MFKDLEQKVPEIFATMTYGNSSKGKAFDMRLPTYTLLNKMALLNGKLETSTIRVEHSWNKRVFQKLYGALLL